MAAAAIGLAMLPGAHAETFRFPESGKPAFVITTPGGWTHQRNGDGNMLLLAANHTASYALTIGEYAGTLDDLASGGMKTIRANPPRIVGPAEISDFRGYAYDSEVVSPGGVHINLHMIAVKIGKHHMATMTLEAVEGIASDDFRAAQSIVQNTTIDSDAPRLVATTTSVPAISLPGASAIAAASVAPNAITLRACNHAGSEASVASMYIPIGEQRWLNTGWTSVPVGQCVDLFETQNRIFYARAETSDGPHVVWGGGSLHCVERPGPYRFYMESGDATCPEGRSADFADFDVGDQKTVMIWNLNPP